MTVTPVAANGDLLLPTPRAGALVGYGRVSTREQNLARQQAALAAAGCAKCFFDKASGKNADRPELSKVFDYIRPGDALTVVSLDRLGRSLEDAVEMALAYARHQIDEATTWEAVSRSADYTEPYPADQPLDKAL